MKLILGDSLVKLRDLPTSTVDAVVTDPPYGLKFMGKQWDHDVPGTVLWREVFRVLKPGGHLLSFFGTRTYHAGVSRIEEAGFEIRNMIAWLYGQGFPKSHNLDDGFGTALKPALEPIVMAMRPLEKGLTYKKNFAKHGTGALNIDGTRIGFASEADAKAGRSERATTSKGFQAYAEGEHDALDRSDRSHIQGRWPANVLFDESAAVMLDEQTGALAPRGKYKNNKVGNGEFGTFAGAHNNRDNDLSYGDSGGASRFFYVAKASKRERNAGTEGMPEKQVFGDDGGTYQGLSNSNKASANFHPTVKPIRLMEYLCTLITPRGGIILDPFMGSGTTGVAAKRLGFEFIGIEHESEYLEIARKRIEHAIKERDSKSAQLDMEAQ